MVVDYLKLINYYSNVGQLAQLVRAIHLWTCHWFESFTDLKF